MNTHDMMRQALKEHGITRAELISELKRHGLCGRREQKLVDQFINGG
jgi:hypothetical protein